MWLARRSSRRQRAVRHPSPPAPPHRHPLGAHLAAGPARHRRRRRHERLHRRGRPGGWPRPASRWRSSPGPPPATCRRWSRWRPACTVRHVTAGPFEGLAKEDLPAQLCAFTTGVLRAEAARPPGCYDLVHSHYWLSGQVGWLAKERWGVPLVHTAHTLAKVKNALLADGDRPEPQARVIGEEQVVAEADRLVANTRGRGQRAGRAATAPTRPGRRGAARRRPGPVPPAAGRPAAARAGPPPARACPSDGYVVAFVGRIQPLKAPGRAAPRGRRAARARPGAGRRADRGDLRRAQRQRAWTGPTALIELAASLGIADGVRFLPPLTGDELADAVPGRRPGRGAVAQRVVRAGRAGGAGLRHAGGRRRRRRPGHRRPRRGQRRAGRRPRPGRLGPGARRPARRAGPPAGLAARRGRSTRGDFSWDRTAAGLLAVYREAMTEHRAPTRGRPA